MRSYTMSPNWKDFHEDESTKDYFKKLEKFINNEYTDDTIQHFTNIYPPRDKIYRAFDLCPLKDIRVVIIGQDPYHGPGQANGLAFAVDEDAKIPASLRNIIKESKTTDRTLISWAKQGIFLLNTCLTVRESKPASHSGKGWETYTDNAIKYLLNNSDWEKPLIFCLWGRHAENKRSLIEGYDNVAIISTSHPSPLSATKTSRPFLGSEQFQTINDLLRAGGEQPIRY